MRLKEAVRVICPNYYSGVHLVHQICSKSRFFESTRSMDPVVLCPKDLYAITHKTISFIEGPVSILFTIVDHELRYDEIQYESIGTFVDYFTEGYDFDMLLGMANLGILED